MCEKGEEDPRIEEGNSKPGEEEEEGRVRTPKGKEEGRSDGGNAGDNGRRRRRRREKAQGIQIGA